MASAQDLRKRIKSVRSTQQITKAMKMVASARLHKAQSQAKSTRPYADKLSDLLNHLLSSAMEITAPLAEARASVKRRAYVVVGADKGLAGAYTSNLIKTTLAVFENENPEDMIIITSGRKVKDHLRHRGYTSWKQYQGFSDKPSYTDAVNVARDVTKLFLEGEVDEVIMIYTYFINSLTHEVHTEQLLPIVPKQTGHDETKGLEFIYVPNKEELFAALLPKVLEINVYDGMLQSAACELAARMTAMTTATDNAGQLIETLDLQYNRLRQSQITNEISEIIGGANALQ